MLFVRQFKCLKGSTDERPYEMCGRFLLYRKELVILKCESLSCKAKKRSARMRTRAYKGNVVAATALRVVRKRTPCFGIIFKDSNKIHNILLFNFKNKIE